ncbi:MAG TPA: thioredoxin family protein [Saprospiraceae bacterium]|jgi:small redox-active disulfide protein 2|nr:TM0996/MTH895 family glutaredoxin-like protein [Saprospiraceae bacterium]MBK7467206.1 TM0996/MTH895 family glutaredoxin-like protein [Saprospiraceae bacterium]MBK9995079.1 TM0996/MTH895 family glutaredoxin-like protein [Saprospiraceae bacterium]MBP7257796.1 TM0996/MTH895 family glutaredoxin-like protein [Chitinophagales bacterium]HUN15331.1 thioredoxin family protein [Saprospiraceae bacterium]
MQIIKILGTGCAKCKQTEQLVKEVIAKNGIDAVVEKIEDIQLIMEYNILSTPAVVVDEVVKIKGRVPSEKEILEAIK